MIGVGGLGSVAVQLLRALTPARVVAVDVRETSRQLALDRGADLALDANGLDAATVRDALGGGATIVLDFVGNDATLALAAAIFIATLSAQERLGPQGGPTNKNTTPPPGITPLPVDLFTS